jgi:mannose-6-phosphate isomerase class I
VATDGAALRDALARMARSWFRPRPWFEPGPWGGQWIREKIPALPQDAPNYAWSFELIAPENGIILESEGVMLEVSLDMLMLQEGSSVLGRAHDRFGSEFPIRFDFLDTFDGGNLSVQVHPRTDYIREHFGERFTQDETYYILDCAEDARVYLGFVEGVDRDEFRRELERSRETGCEIDVERFVNTVPAHRHDLFLIPNQTIHCSGRDNLVLEISATPYIFTFKMYDWVRRDLEGNLRPINIERAFENLAFERTASVVEREHISRPRVAAEGADWRLVDLPTHRDHFYDVRRYEFDTVVDVATDGDCHVMSLVEGRSITLETADGMRQRFNYAETFVVPAAARSYRLVNEGPERAMVVQAFVRRDG